MPNSLDRSGLTTATQSELYTNQSTALQTIYGPNINLQSDTPDGQWLNILIQAQLDLEALIQSVYSSFDINQAIGTTLDQRAAIVGVQRQAGTFTVVNISITVTQSLNLYGLDQSIQQVFTVADGAGNQYQLIATQIGITGTQSYAFQAANPGSVIPIPNSITIPVTIVLGVSSVNNPTAYTVLGVNEETDAAFRVRILKSVSLSSQGYLQGLLAALLNINGIVDAFVYENDTGSTDADFVPGHSIWVIVDGTPTPPLGLPWTSVTTYSYGDIASSAGVNYISWQNNNTNHAVTNPLYWGVYNPVAQAIYNKRNAGCGMFGSTSYTVTQIDGTLFTVHYDSVEDELPAVKFTATSLDLIHAPDIVAIKAQLPSIFVPGVNAEININQLATYVQQIDPNTLVTNAGFSNFASGSYTNTFNPPGKEFRLVISSENIIVLPMILSCPNGVPVINSSTGVVTTTDVSVASGGSHIPFTGLGGYDTLTYSIQSGSGSINSSSGVYTSSSAGTDVVLVTDSLSNTATATVTVT